MARIRSIKPEFWTDETLVRMPFEARLLYIGLWNFADDRGFFWDEPERIRMQVFPGDPVDIIPLLDLLLAAGRLNRYATGDGRYIYEIAKFQDHQKVDKPAKSKLPDLERCKKVAIPAAARRAVAEKYGCQPGGRVAAECFYCGEPGNVVWWPLRNGRPSGWVSFGLELDHFVAEADGGPPTKENIVLACRHCNRSKSTLDGLDFLAKVFPSLATQSEAPRVLARSREDSTTEGRGVEGSGKEVEGKGSAPPPEREKPTAGVPTPIPPTSPPDQWLATDFWAWAQDRRIVSGGLPEKLPRIEKLNGWFSAALMTPGVTVPALKEGFYAFGDDPHWEKSKPPWPFAAFMSQWDKYTKPEAKRGNAA